MKLDENDYTSIIRIEMKIILILLIPLFMSLGVIDTKKPVIYTVFVDQIHGFYKVYEEYNTVSKPIIYENNTLQISVRDIVFWTNDADPEISLTITSNLWNNSGYLSTNYKRFGYTFNESGIYKIYVKEFPKFSQTIIVRDVENIKYNGSNKKQIPILNITNSDDNKNEPVKVSDVNATDSERVSSISIKIHPNLVTVVLILVLILLIILSGRIKE